MFLIHSSTGAVLAFRGLITILHSELAFSEAKDLINSCLPPGSDTILLAAEVNLCKRSLKASLGTYIILVNDSVLFPDSSTFL